MKVATISLFGVHPFVDGSIELDPALHVITGAPGSGKTSLLEALLAAKDDVAAYGARPSPRRFLRPGGSSAKIAVDWLLDAAEVERTLAPDGRLSSELLIGPIMPAPPPPDALVSLLAAYEHSVEVGKVEYFPAHRSLGGRRVGTRRTSLDEERRVRTTSGHDKYAGLAAWLCDLGMGLCGKPMVERFDALLASISDIALVGVERQKDETTRAVFQPRGRKYVVGAEHLSASHAQAVLFAGTFTRLQLDRSIVLVDSPELDWPSHDVVRLVGALRAAGANQLVVATGSQDLVRSVAKGQLTTLEAA